MIRLRLSHCIFSSVILIMISGCRSCPDKKLVGPFLIYPTLDKLLVYSEVNTMTFVSDLGNEMKFEKYFNRHKEIIVKETNHTRECEYYPSISYPIFTDYEQSDYNFATENQDTLLLNYRPSIDNWPSEHEWSYTYYHSINLYGPSYYAFSRSKAQWKTESSVEFFKDRLDGPYELEGIRYEEVYYWERPNSDYKQLYFNDEYGLIGFDIFNEKWIRTK